MVITKTRITGVLMAALLVLSAPVLYADSGNGGNFGDNGWGHHDQYGKGRFFHKLHLTDDQKKQLKDIWQKQEAAKKTFFEQIKTDKEALTNELLQTTPDVNKINDLKSKMEALHAQVLDNRINSNLEVKKILNAEQFAKYLDFQSHKFSGRSHRGEEVCSRHKCQRHHHGNWGDQHESGYGEHHSNRDNTGDNE
ncbi:MAG: Spy/CpxP family protein refolding chaperone [Candidatus Omnitrophica bacterium]|nr:Spy/CpxP family protein refolding chaperone [Candidatus Omnitrophota bacterium]